MRSFRFWRITAFVCLLLANPLVQATAPKFAVMLPQSGRMAKAAEAIRDGLLAAYYQDSATLAETPSLHFYDSADADIARLMQQVRDDGASLVIGPLDREHIETLIRLGTRLPLPVLALNRTEGQLENLFQFALAPEDELQRLASWMKSENIRHPLVLAATDEGSQRQLKIFQSSWLGEASGALRVVLLDPARKGGVTASIRDMVRSAGAEDALFLATPSLARQVQPALTYYHSTLPLYSHSSAWDPVADVSGQKDLDGVRFCDSPWMLDADMRPEQQALYQAFSRPAGGYDRLHAFGADAWTLALKWKTLQQGEPLALRSGVILLDPSRHLRRTPTCAEVRNGNAVPVPASSESAPPESGSGG